jgi:hypothetical protein
LTLLLLLLLLLLLRTVHTAAAAAIVIDYGTATAAVWPLYLVAAVVVCARLWNDGAVAGQPAVAAAVMRMTCRLWLKAADIAVAGRQALPALAKRLK